MTNGDKKQLLFTTLLDEFDIEILKNTNYYTKVKNNIEDILSIEFISPLSQIAFSDIYDNIDITYFDKTIIFTQNEKDISDRYYTTTNTLVDMRYKKMANILNLNIHSDDNFEQLNSKLAKINKEY
jgi:hypothetical protein